MDAIEVIGGAQGKARGADDKTPFASAYPISEFYNR
jgi:hypothetical protein